MAELPRPCSRGEVHPFQIHTAPYNHAIVSHYLSQKNKFLFLKRLRGPHQSNLLFSGAAAKKETSVDGRADGGDSQANEKPDVAALQSARKDSHSLQIPQIGVGVGGIFGPIQGP